MSGLYSGLPPPAPTNANMADRPSLRGRAALAVALLIGFYLLALGIAAGLAYIPYAEWVYTNHVNGRILIFCGVGCLAILRGIFPQRDHFEPPGPTVTAAEQPRLFEAIEEVSRATKQAMPDEVYLVPEINAFVAQRGGVMGFGSRRVMGIGLPLLETLTVTELCAVIAHEFGHYEGGDTKLGPWIYKTRASITRTLQSLARHSGGILQKPFEWYGIGFARLTLAISRRQEFVADELAARTYGADSLERALMGLERSGVAYGAFMQEEFIGVVKAGFRPPLVEGFARFRAAPAISTRLEEYVTQQIESGVAGPYDSHPSLKERLAALRALPQQPVSATDNRQLAITLVDDVPSLEGRLIGSMVQGAAPPPVPISWDDVPDRVFAMGWVANARPALEGLDGLTPAIFPDIAARLETDEDVLARQLGVARSDRPPETARAIAEGILGSGLSLLLDEHRRRAPERIRLSAPPGEPVTFHFGGGDEETLIVPFTVLERLKSGALETSEWLMFCQTHGLADEDIGAACRRASDARARLVANASLSR